MAKTLLYYFAFVLIFGRSTDKAEIHVEALSYLGRFIVVKLSKWLFTILHLITCITTMESMFFKILWNTINAMRYILHNVVTNVQEALVP